MSSTYPFFKSLNFYRNLEISIYRPYACHVMRALLELLESLVKLTHIIGYTWEKAVQMLGLFLCGKKSRIIRSKIELSMGGVDENDARENFIKLPIKQDKSEPMSCNIFCTCEFLMHLTFSHSLSTSFKSKKGIAQTLFH